MLLTTVLPSRKHLALVAAALLASAYDSKAALFRVNSLADFLASYPSATLEDFEEARVPDGTSSLMGNTLNASTSNAIFSAGDIAVGLQIRVSGSGSNLFVSSPGFATYLSHAVSYNSPSTPSPEMFIDFLGGNVRGFSFDLTSNPSRNDVRVALFSGATQLATFDVPDVLGGGSFFGVTSNSEIITHVHLSGVLGNDYFGVDNIRYAVPEPGIATLALPILAMASFSRRSVD